MFDSFVIIFFNQFKNLSPLFYERRDNEDVKRTDFEKFCVRLERVVYRNKFLLFLILLFMVPVLPGLFLANAIIGWNTRGDRDSFKIKNAPASFAVSILTFIFGERKFSMYFADAVSDMRIEHSEALLAHKQFEARLIVVRYYFSLVFVIVAFLLATIGRAYVKIRQLM